MGRDVTLLVTRPQPDAATTVARLQALGMDALASPVLVRKPLAATLPAPETVAALAITSTNALRTLAERDAIVAYRHLPVFAVGDRTAAEAEALGFVQVTSAAGGVSELTALLQQNGPDGPIFYPAAQDRAAPLAPLGKTILTVPVYSMAASEYLSPEAVTALAAGLTGALFYSRRSAEIFVTLADKIVPPPERLALAALCISAMVAEPLMASGYGLGGIAAQPDDEAMMSLTLAFVRGRNTP